MYNFKGQEVKVCNGEDCIHRYRCYRFSIFQDSLFKGMDLGENDMINVNECINPEDEETPGYTFMWLPDISSL